MSLAPPPKKSPTETRLQPAISPLLIGGVRGYEPDPAVVNGEVRGRGIVERQAAADAGVAEVADL